MSRKNAQPDFGFSRDELRQFCALKTPAGLQRFLDDLAYNLATPGAPRRRYCAIALLLASKERLLPLPRFVFSDSRR
jgi:hypothetical protein